MVISTVAAATGGGILNFFITGGIFMIPLLLCSVVGVAIIILRSVALRERAVLPAMIEREIEQLQPGTRPERLARVVHGDPSPLARVIRVALDNLSRTKSDNIEAVQIRARQEILHLESGLVVLELIVGLGPLLGLLGAVSGLVGVFGSLGAGAAGADPTGVARGISEALHTTIMGLAVAIPSLVAHSYYAKKVEVFAIQMEALVGTLLSKCYGHDSTQPSPVALEGGNAGSAALASPTVLQGGRQNTRKGRQTGAPASDFGHGDFSFPQRGQKSTSPGADEDITH